MLISDLRLRQFVGALWLLDGLLQLQPRMFTSDLVASVMAPAVQGQPAPVAASLGWINQVAASHVVLVNLTILLVQVALGLCLLTGYRANAALLASVVWSVVVWYAGEGLGMLLSGQSTVLTGAPGAVLLYAALALALLPRTALGDTLGRLGARLPMRAAAHPTGHVLSRDGLRQALAGLWLLAAVLQLQPFWWQPGQITQTVSDAGSPGMHWLAGTAGTIEGPLNAALIVACLALAAGLVAARTDRQRQRLLVASVAMSLLLWWTTQTFGMLLSGLATDLNSGPLLVLMRSVAGRRVCTQT